MKAFVVVVVALVAFVCSSSPSAAAQKKHHATDSTKTVGQTPLYVCPMHPEVTATKPGACPKCKMALVKKEVKLPAVKKQSQTDVHGASSMTAADSYVCPMHADVTSDKPGTCPKCKMDLVKKKS